MLITPPARSDGFDHKGGSERRTYSQGLTGRQGPIAQGAANRGFRLGYICSTYHLDEGESAFLMAATRTAKLFKHGRSQAVRLPKEFRMPGTEVRVRRIGRDVLLEPIEQDRADVAAIFAEIDRLGGADFLPEGRPEQPAMPTRRAAFEE